MKDLIFDGKVLPLIEHNGRLWVRSVDIARAMGYSRVDKISQIYNRRKSEFSDSMTCTTENLSLGHRDGGLLRGESRLFSLRGAHLLGMFARTSVGVKFRRWVLDQLEKIENDSVGARSLIAEFYQVKAKLDKQNEFASLCGRGLSEHRRKKGPLLTELDKLYEKLQPSLFLS